MNIISISTYHYPYGMAGSKRIRLFMEFLSLKNDVHAIVIGKNNGRNDLQGIKNNVTWSFIKFGRFEYFLNLFKIIRILKKNYTTTQKNIIYLYNGIGLTNILFAIIGRKMGYYIFTDIVENYSLHNEKVSLYKTILHKIDKRIDHSTGKFVDGIIVISHRLKEKYLNFNIKKERINLIPISSENLNLHFDKKVSNNFLFVYSGTFGKKDGVEYLIKAFKSFAKSYDGIKLVLSGIINTEIKNLIYGVKNIEYVGLVGDNEYYQFLKNADVLLMTRIDSPYANTGFPFKLGEYLATGNPVIVTRVSDVDKYLVDKVDAIFANPSDVNSIIEAMEFCYNNQKQLADIGNNGKQKCIQYFNPVENGLALHNFFKRTINYD